MASNSATASAATDTTDTSDIDQLRIAGLTGVDVGLEIAGPGSRSYAFLLDWQIRAVLALGWLGIVAFAQRYLAAVFPIHVKLAYIGGLPALAIYLLYHPVLEVVMRGRTPGKRRAGLRLVTRSGATPGTGALLMRNVFRLIDCMPGLYVVGLMCCFITRERVRIGDLAAGTLLIVDTRQPLPTSALEAVASGALTPAAAELIEELLERWESLDAAHRLTLARGLLSRLGESTAVDPAAAGSADWQLRERLRHALASRPRH